MYARAVWCGHELQMKHHWIELVQQAYVRPCQENQVAFPRAGSFGRSWHMNMIAVENGLMVGHGHLFERIVVSRHHESCELDAVREIPNVHHAHAIVRVESFDGVIHLLVRLVEIVEKEYVVPGFKIFRLLSGYLICFTIGRPGKHCSS